MAINCPQTAQFWPFFEHLLKWSCIIFILIHLIFLQEPHFVECIKIFTKAWPPCLTFTEFSWVKKLLATMGKFWIGRSFTNVKISLILTPSLFVLRTVFEAIFFKCNFLGLGWLAAHIFLRIFWWFGSLFKCI